MLRDHAGPLRLSHDVWLAAGRRALLTLWVGSLWTVGYLVAPALFAVLEDRAVAGRIAGELFHVELWVTLVCAPLFVLGEWARRRRRALAGPVLMLAAQLTIELLLRPRIAAAARGSDAFAWLHGTAALLYLAASLLGLWLVLARPPAEGSVRA